MSISQHHLDGIDRLELHRPEGDGDHVGWRRGQGLRFLLRLLPILLPPWRRTGG